MSCLELIRAKIGKLVVSKRVVQSLGIDCINSIMVCRKLHEFQGVGSLIMILFIVLEFKAFECMTMFT